MSRQLIPQLLLVKRLFDEASSLAARTDPISCGIAISMLQDSVEMFVWALVKHNGIGIRDGDGFTVQLEALKKQGIIMSGDKSARHSPDNKRIDVHDPNELRHWSKSLGVTPEKLKEVVARVGTSAEQVRAALK